VIPIRFFNSILCELARSTLPCNHDALAIAAPEP
jgi:hypothetical protein